MYIDAKVLEYLKTAGWHPGRCCNIKKIRRILINDGYLLNDTIEEFISEFAGIKLIFPLINWTTRAVEKDQTHDIDFDVENAARMTWPQNVTCYENRCGEKLVVIGSAYNDHLTLLMSFSGKFYCAYDELFWYIADNKFEAIEKLIENEHFQEIP